MVAVKVGMILGGLLFFLPLNALAWEGPASEFAEKSCGATQGEFWNLWSNGDVAQWFRFPKSGEYAITVVAYGSKARQIWPRMKIAVDLEPVKTVSVDARPRRFVFPAVIEKGVRRFSISFLNDYFSPDGEEDRNLYLGEVTLRPRGGGGASPEPSDPPDWRAEAREGIARHRMGDLRVRVTDGRGKALPGVAIRARLERHAFPFGCAVSSGFVSGRWSEEDRKAYGSFFGRLFNSAVHENALKWGGVNRRGPDSDWRACDAILNWCLERSITVRGHCILWANEKRVPAFARKLDEAGLRRAVLDRIEEVLLRYRGRINEYDLNNEMIHVDYFARRLGEPFRVEMFKKSHAVDPEVKFYVNDFNILSGGDLETYVGHIQGLIDAGAPVGGIGCQGHFGDRIPHPRALKMVLDRLARFGLPIKITEFDIDTGDEARQAIELHDFYTVCFSHPAVAGILLWGFWEGAHWRPRGALFDRDWRAKPAAQAYRRLLFSEWHTEERGRSDGEGRFQVRAFYGRYRVTLEREGEAPVEREVDFPKGASGREIAVRID
jgi:GH35 family endo-1,4-beta-xylanase